MGRKATGPPGIAGLPKQGILKRPVVSLTRAFLRLKDTKKKEEQEIEGAGREKDIQIIPALEGGRSSLPSRDSILALFIVFPSLPYRRRLCGMH